MAFTTKKSLLEKVRAGDEISWNEFYRTYKPLILLCGRDCSLTQTENEELVQLVMMEIFRKDILKHYDLDNIPDHIVFQYDPARGRFRHYLKKIIRHHALKLYARRKATVPLDEITEGENPPSDDWDEKWEREWTRHLLNMALFELKTQVQPDTYVAFELYALQQKPVREVAEFLHMSVSAVYTAKSRCIADLKKIMANLEER